jgi:hypothetical protein
VLLELGGRISELVYLLSVRLGGLIVLNLFTRHARRVVGSYGTHTIAKPVQQVDIAVRIPKASLFFPLLPAFANSLKRRKKPLPIAEFGYLSCAR